MAAIANQSIGLLEGDKMASMEKVGRYKSENVCGIFALAIVVHCADNWLDF